MAVLVRVDFSYVSQMVPSPLVLLLQLVLILKLEPLSLMENRSSLDTTGQE